jgi:ATP phosphoribosyltransferase
MSDLISDPMSGPNSTSAVANLSERDKLVLALPKGRILEEVMPLLRQAGVDPEPEFDNPASRKLRFDVADGRLEIVRVRSFDVATFVAFGGADFGVCGNDVIMEFDYPELYAPVDLDVGHCKLVVAAPRALVETEEPSRWSHLRVATKYPNLTARYFASRGVQAECVKLNGAIELAPSLGLCRRIVDLVSTGQTLAANGLVIVEEIAQVSARLVVNRASLKTRAGEMNPWLERIQQAVQDTRDAS